MTIKTRVSYDYDLGWIVQTLNDGEWELYPDALSYEFGRLRLGHCPTRAAARALAREARREALESSPS